MKIAHKIGIAILVMAVLAGIGALIYFVPLAQTREAPVTVEERVEIQNIKVEWSKDKTGEMVFKPGFDVVNKGDTTFTGYVFVYARNASVSPANEGSWPSWASVSAGKPKDPGRGYKIIINHRITMSAGIGTAGGPAFNEAWVMVYDEQGTEVNRSRILKP